jgi:DMSO/TMAO reductase YedYZ molybdopterin-dependent catalytic subunit
VSDEGRRVPPGQVVTTKWPVLTYGAPPRVDTSRWVFRITGAVGEPRQWTWDELARLPRVEVVSDVHCVTRWSRFDNRWRGIRPRDLLAAARPRPEARYALVHAEPDYTTNLPLAALLDDDVLLALEHDGRPLPSEHGGPMRLVVPRLYFWKSAKWVRGLEFFDVNPPGFWEQNGYHMHADPWRQERYSDQETDAMQRMRAEAARKLRERT